MQTQTQTAQTETKSAGGAVAPSTLSIVVGLAFTDADGFAFDQAARMARRVPRSELHLVHVFSDGPTEARSRELVDHLRLYANEKAAAVGGLKAMTVGIHLRTGKPVREIVQLATEVRADLIVLGSHKGPHLKSWLLGSTAERLVATAPCPVLIAAPKAKAAEVHEPEIEPACPDCLRVRASSDGDAWWCERHAHRALRAHTFSYQRELPFATHDSEVIPTGVRM
jgi:nucleotide-binding universal stress UspA family protein